jgi:peptidyl-tRNA hydrolase, PTH1 family
MKIIFAQGNPEQKYALTRHNLGFLAVDSFGNKYDATWKEEGKFGALVATLTINSEKVLLVKPLSYYNDTGLVARKIIDFYKADPAEDLLVIHDDLSLPLGTVRIRQKGSDAGNNGIKSLNAHVGESYGRIRVGIWNELRDRMDDASFVLSNFSKDEIEKLGKDVMPKLYEIIEAFISSNLEQTSHKL